VAANSGRKTNWCQRSYDAKGELAANPRAQSGIGRFTFTKKLPAKLAATLISQFCAKLLVINNVASKSKVGGQSDSRSGLLLHLLVRVIGQPHSRHGRMSACRSGG